MIDDQAGVMTTTNDEVRFEVIQTTNRGATEIICRFGEVTLHRDQVNLAKAIDRRRFAKSVLGAIGEGCPFDLTTVEQELLRLADEVDRRGSDEPDSPASVPLSGEELDASQVVRPELICSRDVSAIAIPRLVSTNGRNCGEWLHFVRRGEHRTCLPLQHQLDSSDGESLWLTPIPGDPTTSDVRQMNRWSRESRDRWLNGDPSPSTRETLRLVAERIDRYVVLPPENAPGHGLTLAAWVMMTYAYPALAAVPYLYLAGPAGSGKTRTMDVLSRMVFRSMMTGNASAPVIFRTRHTFGGTLLLDEAERMRDARSPDVVEILSILLAGYRRGGTAMRMEPSGDSFRSVSFDCFGPAVLGCIKGLPPALASRCITVRMMRAAKGDEQVGRSLNDTPEQAKTVLDALHFWAIDHAFDAINQEIPETSLANRDAELWGPLLRIVAHAGDEAALGLLIDHAESQTEAAAADAAPEFDGLMLSAIYQLRRADRTPTAGEILAKARQLDDEAIDNTWNPRMVSGILKRYGLTSKKSNGRKVFRGSPVDIADIAKRYGHDVTEGLS